MNVGHQYDRFRSLVKPALASKLNEFQMLGYGKMTENELWNYLTKKKWRKAKEEIHLYEIIQDILSVKANDYMNFATVEAFKLTDFNIENEEERKELFK